MDNAQFQEQYQLIAGELGPLGGEELGRFYSHIIAFVAANGSVNHEGLTRAVAMARNPSQNGSAPS